MINMPFATGRDVKSGVIYEWLRGNSRDKIAEIYNISAGGVTNIINEWRNNIGCLYSHLGFKNTLEKMEPELSSLKIEIEANRRIISSQTHVGSLVQNILGMGLTEQDILEINSILLNGGFNFDNDK